MLPREDAAEGGENRPVSPPVVDAATDLALEDTHLVTKDDQLDVLVSATTPKQGRQLQGPAEPQVEEREHGVR